MPTQAQIAYFLLSPRGRAGRLDLLISAGALVGIEIFLIFLTKTGAGSELTLWSLKALSLWIGLAAVVKRLHDIGLSGWWTLGGAAVLCIWTTSLAALFIVAIGAEAFMPGGDAYLALMGLVMLPAIGMTLWLHLAPGEPETNRFGPASDQRAAVKQVAA